MNLRDFLKDRRIQRRMSRQELADLTGISVNTLAKYETTDQVPSAGKMALLCLHLKIDPRQALKYALGEGEGEGLSVTDPKLYRAFDDFLKGLSQFSPAEMMAQIQQQLQMLTIAQKAISLFEHRLGDHKGSLQDLIDKDMPAIMPDVMKGLLREYVAPEHLAKMMSGPSQSDPSRPAIRNPEGVTSTSDTPPKTQRPKPVRKRGARAK